MSDPKRRILFVDDDAKTWSPKLKPLLEKAGWEWSALDSVREASEAIDEEKLDLVLLDLGFPAEGLSGPQAVIELRKRAPHIPIIVFTGTAPTDLSAAVECVRSGAWDYLPKTQLDPERLLREAEKAAQMIDAHRHKKRLLASIQRNLDARPAFVSFPHEIQADQFLTVFAFRLLGLMPSRDLSKTELVRKQQEWAERIVQVVSSPDAPRAVELRYTVTPQEGGPNAVATWLIGRGFGRTVQRATEAAEELWADLIPFLQLADNVCPVTVVAEEAQLRSLLRPFRADWAIEFVREVCKLEPKGSINPFIREPPASPIHLPISFKVKTDAVVDFCAVAAKLRHSLTLSIDIEPFKWGEIVKAIVTDAERQLGTTESLAREDLDSLNLALDNPRAVRVVVASQQKPQGMPPLIAEVVAKEFTGGSPEAWKTKHYSNEQCLQYQRSWGWAHTEVEQADLLRVLYHSTEAASLLRLPAPESSTRESPAPASLSTTGDLLLGVNRYRGQEQKVFLQRSDRNRHLYTIGQTGTGKTTFLRHLILQDIANGEGVGVIDPHGDLIESILPHIPEKRIEDVILFDPSDTDRPPGLNLLEVRDVRQRGLVVQDAVDMIVRLSNRMVPGSTGSTTEHQLRMTFRALAEAPGGTLADLPRMWSKDPAFRKWVLQFVTTRTVKEFWEVEFPETMNSRDWRDSVLWLRTRVGRITDDEMVANIIGQPTSSFDVREVIDKGRILLANISKGRLGDINSDFLGFVLVNKLEMAAFSRADVPPEERRPFYLYMDEFQNFTTDSIATILAEARKYGLSLHLAHQFIGQLSDNIRAAVLGNVGTIVAFRSGLEDAKLIAGQFYPVFDRDDLLSLRNFTAYVKMLSHDEPQQPFSLRIPPPPEGGKESAAYAVREYSRGRYGRARAQVEKQIRERLENGSD